MTRLQLLFLLSCYLVGLQANALADSIGWTSGERWHKFEVRLEPSGDSFGNRLYLCRHQLNGDIIPGKLVFKTTPTVEEVSCDVSYRGKASGSSYEVLNGAAGTTSWIPYNESVDIYKGIVGGKISGVVVYVCRALVQYNNGVSLVPGWVDPVTESCHVEIGGYTYQPKTNFEVLTRNPLGQLLGVTKPE